MLIVTKKLLSELKRTELWAWVLYSHRQVNFLLVKIILILVHGVEAGREGLQRLSNAGTTAPMSLHTASNFKMSPVIFNHYSESDAAADKKFILKFSISAAGASAISSNTASFDDFQQRSTLKDSYHGGNILMAIMVDFFSKNYDI